MSSCARYETPLYDLPIDAGINEELLATGEFEVSDSVTMCGCWLRVISSISLILILLPQMMNVEQDEDEHSIEMHLSYIARVMESRKGNFTVVPVLVGSLSHEKQVNNQII